MELSDSLDAIEHNGRHYNNNIYPLPSDAEEAERLELQHDLLRAAFDDRIVLAPLELAPGAEVLDIGTGKGAWALDFAATYPNADKASILCIDVAPRLFPRTPPPNMSFMVSDILAQSGEEWRDRFAFVHQRLLMAVYRHDQWADQISKIYTITAPGGWAQLFEANLPDHFSEMGPATTRVLELYMALGKSLGVDWLCSLRLEDIMKQAGFVDVEVVIRETPLGESYGEGGTRAAKNIGAMFRGLKSPILRLGGFGMVRKEEEFDALMDEMEREWKSPGCKAGWYAVVGRKAK